MLHLALLQELTPEALGQELGLVVTRDMGWGQLRCALIQSGPSLVCSSEAVGNNMPAAFFCWHCHSILDQDITQSTEKTAMF